MAMPCGKSRILEPLPGINFCNNTIRASGLGGLHASPEDWALKFGVCLPVMEDDARVRAQPAASVAGCVGQALMVAIDGTIHVRCGILSANVGTSVLRVG